jgi:uncharacterized protein YggE
LKKFILATVLSLAASPLFAGELPVSGTGVVTAEPDQVTINGFIRTTDPTSATTALKANFAKMAEVVKALESIDGVKFDAKKDINTTDLQVNKNYSRTTNEEEGKFLNYAVFQNFTLHHCDPSKAGQILDALATSGATIGGVHFGIANQEKYLDQARILAAKDAKRKAGLLAKAAGVKLDELVHVSEHVTNGGNSFRALSAFADAPGVYGGRLTISVDVELRFKTTTLTPTCCE